MKIAMPVDKKSMQTTVYPSFGRTPYFLIYNTDTKESSFMDNGAVASQGGAGIKAAQIIADSQVNAVLTPRCGENAAEVMKTAGISIYKTIGNSIEENIEALKDGKLSILQEIHAGFHNHGGKIT